ncbi:hypothetical protein ACFQ61_04885 [Streptomyces sp. NPDC056500]|uniref:hypothetical protein n=1 Tax=Streptomyces sp. NPDC056500 TaxID=3345840 RepID=UPI0036A36276
MKLVTRHLQPLAEPLRDGSIILVALIATRINAPKYRTLPAATDEPASKDQGKGGPKEGTAKKPAAEPAPVKRVLDKRAPAKRVALLVAGGYVIALSDYTTPVVATATVGWVVCAWALGYKDQAEDNPDEEGSAPVRTPGPAEGSSPVRTPGGDQDPRTALVEWLTLAIGDRPGIHLYELYPAMRQLRGHRGLDDAALRAALKTLGIPVTRSLRIGDIEGRSGIRLTDLTPLLPQSGDAPLSKGGDAGQSADSPPGEHPETAGEGALST